MTGLDEGHTWYGTTRSSIASALADKGGQLLSLNCDGGCRFATLLEYVDDNPQPPATLMP